MRYLIFENYPRFAKAVGKLGPTVKLFDELHARPSIWDTHKLAKAILERLANIEYDPKDDVIVVVGNMVPNLLLQAAILTSYGGFQVMLFNATLREYVPRWLGEPK